MIGEPYMIIIKRTSQIIAKSRNFTYNGAVMSAKERMMIYMKTEKVKNIKIAGMLGMKPLIAKKNAITTKFIRNIKVALIVEAKMIVQRGT